MEQRFCPTCKTVVGGFVYCPKCGKNTEVYSSIESETLTFSPKAAFTGSNQAALWCHLGPLIITIAAALTSFLAIGVFLALFAWVPPLVIKTQKASDEFVVSHAKESFNFQIFWIIATYTVLAAYLVIGVLTLGIGLVLGFVIGLVVIIPLAILIIVVQVRGCLAASAGNLYRYPLVLFRVMK